MSREEAFGDDCFCCQECGTLFRTPLYTISSEFERSHFYDGERIPEIQIRGAEAIASCCSLECLGKQRDKILLSENVRATYPGIGPVEHCSRCGEMVDATQFHLTWVEEVAACQWGKSLQIQPQDARTLAVLCISCCPTKESTQQSRASMDRRPNNQ